jgi:hypothetical protein
LPDGRFVACHFAGIADLAQRGVEELPDGLIRQAGSMIGESQR